MLCHRDADQKINRLRIGEVEPANSPIAVKTYAATAPTVGVNLHALFTHERQVPRNRSGADTVMQCQILNRAVFFLLQLRSEQFQTFQPARDMSTGMERWFRKEGWASRCSPC